MVMINGLMVEVFLVMLKRGEVGFMIYLFCFLRNIEEGDYS